MSNSEGGHQCKRRSLHEEEAVRARDEDEGLRDLSHLQINDHGQLCKQTAWRLAIHSGNAAYKNRRRTGIVVVLDRVDAEFVLKHDGEQVGATIMRESLSRPDLEERRIDDDAKERDGATSKINSVLYISRT